MDNYNTIATEEQETSEFADKNRIRGIRLAHRRRNDGCKEVVFGKELKFLLRREAQISKRNEFNSELLLAEQEARAQLWTVNAQFQMLSWLYEEIPFWAYMQGMFIR